MPSIVRWAIGLLLLALPVTGTCYCPIVCENCYRQGDYKGEYGRAPCNDLESQTECQQANWELLNKRDTTIELVDKIMYDAMEKGNLTYSHASFLRSIMALAVEDNRPEGDCSNGLSTVTGVAGTLTHCFSPKLLQQCAKVRDGTDKYLDGIAPHFEELLRSKDHVYSVGGRTYHDTSRDLGLLSQDSIAAQVVGDMIAAIRVYSGAKTARVRCASFEATTLEIAGAYSVSPAVLFGLTVAMTTFFALSW